MRTDMTKLLKQIHHILCLMALTALAACSTMADDAEGDSGKAGGLTLRFTAGQPTRTTLAASDDVQHVTYVQVYVFDGTDASAQCMASENVRWAQIAGGTASQEYTLQSRLVVGTRYTILAVGLDSPLNPEDSTVNSADNAYSLPDAITIGSTLGQAVATLADGKTRQDIAHTELFAGYAEATVGSTNKKVDVELRRRVAGVLAYFTNIPPGVTQIDVVLNSDQMKDVPLKAAADPGQDFGTTELKDSKTLMSIPVNDEILKSETVYDDRDQKTPVGTKRVGTVLQGAFMLPLPKDDTTADNTLTVVLRKQDNTFTTRQVVMRTTAADGTTAEQKHFSILANQIYRLGDRSATADNPIDLGGDDELTDNIIYIDGNWQADVNIEM